MLKIGISSYCYGLIDVSQALKNTANLGLRNVEIVSFCHLPFNPIDESLIKLVKNELKNNGLKASSYYSTGFDLKSISTAENACIVAKSLGAKLLVGTGTMGRQGDNNSAQKALKMLDNVLDRYDMRFALENHWRNIAETPEDMVNLVKDCSLNIGFALDTGHFVSSGINPMKAVEQLLRRSYDIHLKDIEESGTHRNVPYGEGKAKIEEVLKILMTHDYDGPVTIEFETEDSDPTEGLRKCVEFLRIRCPKESFET